MLEVSKVFLILLQLNFVHIIEGGHSLDIIFNNVTVEPKSNKVKSCHGEVVTVDGHRVINAYIVFSEKLKNAKINATIDIVRGKKKYRLQDIFIDFCTAIRGRERMGMVLIVYNQLSAFGEVPNSCPIPPNVNYSVTNFRMDTEKLPIYTPRIDFFAEVYFSEGKELIHKIIFTGMVESKFADDNKRTNIPSPIWKALL